MEGGGGGGNVSSELLPGEVGVCRPDAVVLVHFFWDISEARDIRSRTEHSATRLWALRFRGRGYQVTYL